MFSIYALPDNEEKRNYILDLFIDNNVEVHFVNENLILRTPDDRNKIKKIRNFTSDNSSPIEELSKILETN